MAVSENTIDEIREAFKVFLNETNSEEAAATLTLAAATIMGSRMVDRAIGGVEQRIRQK